MATSFWIDPIVQRSRPAFMAAVEAKKPEWRERESEINKLMNRLETPDYMVGTPARRRGFSTGRVQVNG